MPLEGKKISMPRKVYVSFDIHDQRSVEAIQILKDAGLRVGTTPTVGTPEPEVMFGAHEYRGISEIRQFAKEISGKDSK